MNYRNPWGGFWVVFVFLVKICIFTTFLHVFDPGLGSSILTRRDGSIREVQKPQMLQKSREPSFIFSDLGMGLGPNGPGHKWVLGPYGPGLRHDFFKTASNGICLLYTSDAADE